MITQNRHDGTNGNEKPRFHPPFPHCLASGSVAQRVTCKNIYRPDLACDRLQRMHGFHISIGPRRRSMPRKVNIVANKPGGCERLPVAKERLFRASVSVGKQCHRMRSRAGRKELKRRRFFGERHFVNADARFHPMGERQTEGEAEEGRRGDPSVVPMQKTSNSGRRSGAGFQHFFHIS
jgi:hypothetical protein